MKSGCDSTAPPLIVHVIFRLAMGGLENGLVNLINRMPRDRYRHAIVSLTDVTEFQQRITRDDVTIVALHKRPGHDLGVYRRAWRALRRLRPAIVHTRNFPTLEFLAVSACAGSARRIHGEHGREIYDLDGHNRTYNAFRKVMSLLVHRYVTVSRDLAEWLVKIVGVPGPRVTQIYNGVDTIRFHPRRDRGVPGSPPGFFPPEALVIGTVGRMQVVKDQVTLVRAFAHILKTVPEARQILRLIIVGEGPLYEESLQILRAEQCEQFAWLPGARSDIPALLNALDVFVLPSLAEGVSNTILEAMASGLPVIATAVGGNVELIEDGRTGFLVPAADPVGMANAIRRYLDDRELAPRQGAEARKKAESDFSLAAMVTNYLALYDGLLAEKGRRVENRCSTMSGVSNDVRPVRNL
ncbi:TIGR03088 family PEP-CTERM/XrtA system glycosyltransferase [Nitrospira moscoviensis]|uniref:TIGR03088 family PEP-CTERM/XrtA system glycosyltransferase n=1 Tax=Nitrospira moscoviensis TaxID=42253 RepID=UPI0019311354|nr:TIGR03088 family PEP-CTERM/XrtA system glycosyltransferase [Nitrospira moscoviensis]